MKKLKQLNRQFELPFSGLKIGIHQFEFPIDQSFFEHFEALSFLTKGEAIAKVGLEKRSTMLLLKTLVKGKVTTPCDRCGDEVTTKINNEFDLIIKFGEGDFEDTDEMIQISALDHKLELLELFYEYVYLSLPLRFTHKKSNCNAEVLQKLEELRVEEIEKEEKTDPRWDVLKNLK